MQPPTDERPRGDAGDPLTGRLLDGRYRVGPRIARGGMAGVYEAIDIRLDRTVAVKVMHPGLGDDGAFAARFVREARSAARLSHPNVVSVFDQGDDDGTLYLAMEYVPGHTLRDLIRKEAPMPPARALALLEPVLSALGAAHRAGLVHRDIKPENVLIADEQSGGRVKVADFGLARAISSDTQHTATGGVLIGTVSYLAPELVVQGRSDARADVYAVGVVLYELLTGAKPHEGDSPIQVAYAHVHADVPPPSRLVPELPRYVDALVARATARDPDQRPTDAQVLLHQAHRVSHALAAGVREDEELTEDLMPRPSSAPPGGSTSATSGGGTSTEPLDRHDAGLAAAPTRAATPAPAGDHEPTTMLQRGGPAPARPRRRSRRGLVLFLVALLVAVLGGAGAWWYGVGRYTPAPAVLGMTQAAAEQELAAAGLTAEIGEPEYSETVREGRVISSDPEPGSRVLDGGTVTLVLSLGKERYDVPKLAGLTLEAAERRLQATNLVPGQTRERYHEEVPEGTVIATRPKTGTTLRPDTAVDLVVSRGPRPIKVRDFTGRSAAKAARWAEKQGLELQRSEEHSPEVAKGDVISQDPVSGTLVKGDAVTVVVSQGPELVTVPDDLVTSGVEAATEQLEALGFTVQTAHSDLYLGLGYVASVSPGEGERVPRGSTITLYLV